MRRGDKARLKPVTTDPEVGWNFYPRIPAGRYKAICVFTKISRLKDWDRRWVCFTKLDIYSEDMERIATLPRWFNLGRGEKPHASRKGDYFQAWVEANGGAPSGRTDRLSPNVFRHRLMTVEVADTQPRKKQGEFLAHVTYSVVRRFISYETGPAARHSRQSSHIRHGRHR